MKLKLLLLLLIFSKVSAQPAWEIPAESQTWYWSAFASTKDKNDEVNYVDFTKTEKLADGKFIYPYAAYNIKEKKWVTALEWVRVDCQKRTAEGLGIYSNNVFGLASSPPNYPFGTLGYSSMNMFCGMDSDRSALIYGVAGYKVDNNSPTTAVGTMHKDIKLNSSNPSLVDLVLYAYDTNTGKTGFYWTYTADCDKKTISTAENNTTLDTNKSEFYSWRYSIQFACKFADEHLRNLKQNKSDPVINNSSLESAKAKCKNLGFKEKTEKYGSCVLELTK